MNPNKYPLVLYKEPQKIIQQNKMNLPVMMAANVGLTLGAKLIETLTESSQRRSADNAHMASVMERVIEYQRKQEEIRKQLELEIKQSSYENRQAMNDLIVQLNHQGQKVCDGISSISSQIVRGNDALRTDMAMQNYQTFNALSQVVNQGNQSTQLMMVELMNGIRRELELTLKHELATQTNRLEAGRREEENQRLREKVEEEKMKSILKEVNTLKENDKKNRMKEKKLKERENYKRLGTAAREESNNFFYFALILVALAFFVVISKK